MRFSKFQVMVMECKRTNVAFFILVLFTKPLLKLPLLFETVFLGHLAFFVVGLHHSPLFTEVL